MITIYLCLLAGLLVGYGIAYLAYTYNPARKALEDALAQKQRELTEYQNLVVAHFQKTAELVETLHAQQNSIVAHLIEGAKALRPQTYSENIIDPTGPGNESAPKDYWITSNTPNNLEPARDS